MRGFQSGIRGLENASINRLGKFGQSYGTYIVRFRSDSSYKFDLKFKESDKLGHKIGKFSKILKYTGISFYQIVVLIAAEGSERSLAL